MLNAKAELFSWRKIAPFINIGGGILQLIATNYSETPLPDVTARTSPNFARNANYQFAYQLGAGINWEMNPNSIVSINYMYQPLTRFDTKGGTNAWSNRKLNYGDTAAHSIFITFTHVLGA